jgi:hypothetical protein
MVHPLALSRSRATPGRHRPGWQESSSTDPLPTVNWRHVAGGKIAWIRVTFDPRPLTQQDARGR